jgi:predicted dehydrogenase
MKRSTQKIRLGIVGCGGITELRHLPALRKLSAFEITALADSNAGKLASIGGTIETASRYENYRELIESPKVEAVAVCVPPEFHTEIALAAIAAGKHVFIEKPLALTIADCDRLTRAAAAMPALKILVGFNLRWHRLIRIARRKIRRAELGDIELIRTVFTSGLRRRDGNADGQTGGNIERREAERFSNWVSITSICFISFSAKRLRRFMRSIPVTMELRWLPRR